MSKGGKKAMAKCRFLLNTNLPVRAFIAWATGRRGHPSLGWLRKHGHESCYTRITLQELKALEARGVLCPGDAARAVKLLEQYGVKYRKMRSTHLRRARQLALQGAIGRGQANDATILLYAKANRLILVSYNYRDLDELAQLLAWSYKVPPGLAPLAPKTTRNYTYVDVIREMRREASIGALRVLEEAEKLGVPRHVAEDLADKVMLYELTPREALARLRELARGNGKGR